VSNLARRLRENMSRCNFPEFRPSKKWGGKRLRGTIASLSIMCVLILVEGCLASSDLPPGLVNCWAPTSAIVFANAVLLEEPAAGGNLRQAKS
jgi:hypothetical protein